MRKIILMMGVSLDGFIEGPNREIDWHVVDEELHFRFNELIRLAGGFISGRVTHELMAAYWPTAAQDPASKAPEVEFAAIWLNMPKIVFSRTFQGDEWNTTVIRKLDPEEVRGWKAQPGGDLLLSGADLAASFMQHNLIDEYRISVHPVLIGQGKPLFPASDIKTSLELIETERFGNGVVTLHYRTKPRD